MEGGFKKKEVPLVFWSKRKKRGDRKKEMLSSFSTVTNWLRRALSHQVTVPLWICFLIGLGGYFRMLNSVIFAPDIYMGLSPLPCSIQPIANNGDNSIGRWNITDTIYCMLQRSYPIKTNPQKLHDGEIIWMYILYMLSFKWFLHHVAFPPSCLSTYYVKYYR